MVAERSKTRAGTLFSLLRMLHLVCFIWSWMEAKKRHRAGRGNGALQRLEFPKGNNICDRILETEAVCGALRTQQFQLRGAEVGNQSTDSRWLARFIMEHLQLLDSIGLAACACRSHFDWGGL
jgi:hypothetical protein